MQIKGILLLALSFLLFSFKVGDYTLLKKIRTNAKFLTTDQFLNCYIISDNQMIEYDSMGIYVANFTDKRLGELNSVDVSNPMKVQLFYRDSRRIITLDNKLATTSSIRLDDLDIQQPLLFCNSYNDALWVYDQQDFQLKRIESSLQISQQSGNVSQILGHDLKPTALIEDNKWLYLNNPETGILIFDYYGNYYKTIAIKDIVSFQIIEGKLVYYKEYGFMSYDLHSFEEKNLVMPKHSSSLIYPRLEKHRYFSLEQGFVELFSF